MRRKLYPAVFPPSINTLTPKPEDTANVNRKAWRRQLCAAYGIKNTARQWVRLRKALRQEGPQ